MHYFPQITFLQSFNGWKCFQNWLLLFCSMLWSHYCFCIQICLSSMTILIAYPMKYLYRNRGNEIGFSRAGKTLRVSRLKGDNNPKRSPKDLNGNLNPRIHPKHTLRNTSAPPPSLSLPIMTCCSTLDSAVEKDQGHIKKTISLFIDSKSRAKIFPGKFCSFLDQFSSTEH